MDTASILRVHPDTHVRQSPRGPGIAFLPGSEYVVELDSIAAEVVAYLHEPRSIGSLLRHLSDIYDTSSISPSEFEQDVDDLLERLHDAGIVITGETTPRALG